MTYSEENQIKTNRSKYKQYPATFSKFSSRLSMSSDVATNEALRQVPEIVRDIFLG